MTAENQSVTKINACGSLINLKIRLNFDAVNRDQVLKKKAYAEIINLLGGLRELEHLDFETSGLSQNDQPQKTKDESPETNGLSVLAALDKKTRKNDKAPESSSCNIRFQNNHRHEILRNDGHHLDEN